MTPAYSHKPGPLFTHKSLVRVQLTDRSTGKVLGKFAENLFTASAKDAEQLVRYWNSLNFHANTRFRYELIK